jgi:hypothetical protein
VFHINAGPNGFTRQMVYQETEIGQEINLSSKNPLYASNVTLQDLLPALLIALMRL